MIDRKIWKGDLLNLAAGNSFYGRDEVVAHRAGSCVVSNDSEIGEPLVEIDGGIYIVKRSDLFELSERECKIARIIGQSSIPEALNGIGREERVQMAEELQELLRADIPAKAKEARGDETA
jgi:hypothetical protein